VNFYLIPQTVFVGDRAVLAIPLDADIPGIFPLEGDLWALSASAASPGFPAELAALTDPEIHKIALERRGGNTVLLIEFSAWSPGRLDLPSFEAGGVTFSGLYIEVSSILGTDGASSVLSAPSPPLAIPGTSLLIYGTMSALVLVLLFILWAGIWGPSHFRNWMRKWKRRSLIRSLSGMEKRIRRYLLKGDKKDYGAMLNYLSVEFRIFLSRITGEDCRAMTAEELGRLPPFGSSDTILTGEFLSGFFRRADDLRFSGAEIAAAEISGFLSDIGSFAEALEKAGRHP
jgi:hypothetical protein